MRQWLDGEVRVFTMPFDSRRTMWQLSFRCSETWAAELCRSPERLLQEAQRRCTGWDPALVEILDSTEEGLVSGHPAYDRDPITPAELGGLDGASRVTLLGDAAHPMSPFKGQGANQAMLDATDLADMLRVSALVRTDKGRDIAHTLRQFEVRMCDRSADKVRKSRLAAASLHSPNALKTGNYTRASVAEDSMLYDCL